MTFQLERVWRSVSAVGTLVRPLTRMTTNVSFQLTQLDRGVVTLCAFVGTLECVTVADMSHQLPGRGELAFTELAVMRFVTRMSIDVILKSWLGLEPSFAN